MFGLGFQEIALLLLIGLLLFGAAKLPVIGKALGQSIREFKKAFQGDSEEEKKLMGKIQSNPDALTLAGHLDELRTRILYCLGIVLAASIISLSFSRQIIELLKFPAVNIVPGFFVLKPAEIISVYVKVALVSGIVFSCPFIFYQFWRFVKPVVEKRIQSGMITWIASASALFISGVIFMYLIVLPLCLKFLLKMTEGVATPVITLNSYISFVLAIILMGGLIFEIPVISAVLTHAGILTPYTMRRKRKEAIFALFIIAALITPTVDIFNMLMFAIPMIILFEISIIVSSFIHKSRIRKAEEVYAIES